MKCAMELMMTATVRAEEIAKEEAIRDAHRRAVKRANTIKYCEELGNSLEAMANNGKKPTVTFFCDKYTTSPMKATTREYADHRTSYVVCGESLDLELMVEWFDSYCFNMVIEDFCYWRYNLGRNTGYKITIVPKPACIG
jgi:hypothetical protein